MTTDKITTWIAAGAIASPAWLPSLQTISQIAALLLPILGVVWLAVQIVFNVREHRRGKPK